MNTKILLASLAGAVASFFLGWLVYGYLLMDLMVQHTTKYEGLMKTEPNMVAIFISSLAFSWLIAFIFDQWANIRTFAKGLTGGMIITLPILISYDLSFYTWMNLYSNTWLMIDVVVGTVFYSLIGGIIALVLGMGKKPAAA